MNNKGMFYTNVNDYETKEDMMNDFIALRMLDMSKDKEIERLNNIINELQKDMEYLDSIGINQVKPKHIWDKIERLKEKDDDFNN